MSSVFFGGRLPSAERPAIKCITIPEAKKRRYPTKHYVYKIVVQWSDGTSTTIYRRYSMFFDFQVKLQELYTALKDRSTTFQGDNCPMLPELPGKILFGRTQVHQVAERRRVKIEEFCEALVNLPAEISQSALVLGFFNTWADDTLQHLPSISKDPTSPITMATSPTSPTSSVINHPDEMDNLEQYRVVVEYVRKDSHQVNLTTGQIVHVIEKHYTGWWMIVTEEEQGYAPAAHLEAIDNTYDSAEPESNIDEEYEVMDTYRTENDDEIELFPGDRVTIINKSMDGWWKIKNSYGVIGFCPATILRKSPTIFQPTQSHTGYENEKDLYQELNIHKPPPRRSTLERTMKSRIYKTPKTTRQRINEENTFEDSSQHYQVPKNNNTSSGSDEATPQTFDSNNPPFSPDHYEMGPYFSEDKSSGHPIYENTDFDTTPSSGANTSNVYQNMDFDEQDKRTKGKKQSPATEDEEYINPEEFARDESTRTTNPTPSSTAKQGSTHVSYKQVTIASMPLSPPSTIKPTKEPLKGSPTHSIKAILTPSKSLGFIDTSKTGLPEEEYIEMDPIYAPVAPDEPEQEMGKKDSHDSKDDPKASFVRSVQKQKSSPDKPVVPQGRVLERTKSLEDMLSCDGDKKPSSPLMTKKQTDVAKQTLKSEYDHLDLRPAEHTPNSSPNISRKPDPARKIHKSALKNLPSMPADFRKLNNPPVTSPTNDYTDSPPPLPPPNFSPSQSSKGSFIPKTYIAIESYASQAQGCLSFNAGDRCMLVRQSNGGWWYVNLGGIEGWTPGDFWKEDSTKPKLGINQPPAMMAPRKPLATKPRSQTHVPDFPKQNGTPSLIETRSGSVGNGVEAKPLPGKPRGQTPPKPRPMHPPLTGKLSSGSPPPPPPPPRKFNPPTTNGTPVKATNDYGLLENATVPALEDNMWFAGSMEREKAEQFLMENGRQREFLVRERTNKKGYYALSIRYHYSVKHFNIDPQANGSYSMGVMNFSSIEEVVKHYQLNSLFIHDGQPVALGQPVRRQSRIKH